LLYTSHKLCFSKKKKGGQWERGRGTVGAKWEKGLKK